MPIIQCSAEQLQVTGELSSWITDVRSINLYIQLLNAMFTLNLLLYNILGIFGLL